MKKLASILLAGTFLFPFAAFAQSAPTSNAILLQLVNLLTQEVQMLQAQLASYQTTAPVAPAVTTTNTPAISAQMVSASELYTPYHYFNATSGLASFDLYFNVTSGSQDIYLPLVIGTTATSGVAYVATGNGLPSISVQCSGNGISPSYTDTDYCHIPAGRTANLHVTASVSGMPGDSYGITVSQLHYKTDPLSSTYYTYSVPAKISASLSSFGS